MISIGHRLFAFSLIGLVSLAGPVAAGSPKVAFTRVIRLSPTSYEFHITVQHNDTSWDHYLDRWEVIGPGGRVLGTRVLHHPHIGELQFSRNLRGVTIPKGVEYVIIRVHDKLHGYGREKLIALPTGDQRDTGVK
ncbi:MAG: hypothetical protein ACI9JL_001919 [Paracoccaceae bacterium]|jgi:hypothetical protein